MGGADQGQIRKALDMREGVAHKFLARGGNLYWADTPGSNLKRLYF